MVQSSATPGKQPPSLIKIFPVSAFSACFAEVCTLPFDTGKVRLQLQGKTAGSGPPKYNGLLGTIRTITKEEGAGALWKGCVPGLHRQCVYGGLRIGLYDPVKASVSKIVDGEGAKEGFATKVLAALFTGAFGIAVANPTDLVKVRLQAQGQGGPKKYPSALAAYKMISQQEGVAALWTGVGPNIVRNSVINATELATYDQVKQMLLATGVFQDNVVTHITSGLGAGLCAVCVGSPVDVVKSRIMGAPAGKYSGTVDCFVKTLKTDGVLAFYKGFGPNFVRLGSWNVIMFLTLEQVKKVVFG